MPDLLNDYTLHEVVVIF